MITTWPAHWPAEARHIARAVSTALDAVQDDDADAFAEATAELAELPYGHAEAVHSAIIRNLLEDTHAGGLSGEDAQALVLDVVAAHQDWDESLDRTALIMVVLGALGVDIDPGFFAGDNQDPEDLPEIPRLTATDSARHSSLVIESLLTKIESTAAPYIRSAIEEIARAETVEMP
ncbi:hypothetical protein [Rhodococcoides trifolii]|nr:hypothetical protein [Rhodococcus trifolii]